MRAQWLVAAPVQAVGLRVGQPRRQCSARRAAKAVMSLASASRAFRLILLFRHGGLLYASKGQIEVLYAPTYHIQPSRSNIRPTLQRYAYCFPMILYFSIDDDLPLVTKRYHSTKPRMSSGRSWVSRRACLLNFLNFVRARKLTSKTVHNVLHGSHAKSLRRDFCRRRL